MPGTYDPELNTLYWGTGNASPDYDGSVRPGDDLYTSSLLAIDPDTGKLKWYFQFTPHDLYDYDAVETPVLVDQEYQGQPRKLIVEANRNGYVYVLDRTTGKFLSATQFVKQLTWAKGVDANGRPMTTDLLPNADGTLICPGVEGATNWYSPSYSETTHLFYFSSLEVAPSISASRLVLKKARNTTQPAPSVIRPKRARRSCWLLILRRRHLPGAIHKRAIRMAGAES